jgi:hypothetical protein
MEKKFVDKPDAIHDEENASPIYGYQNQQIMTLEKAVQSIANEIPNVSDYVRQAKSGLKGRGTNMLTEDESAAIYLYTMPTYIFSTLNRHLGAMDKNAVKPWFPYLKLFITALNKLPSFKGTVWRGIPDSAKFNYAEYACQTWWTVTSASKNLKAVKPYLDEVGSLYAIETINGKDISQYSAIPDEQEVILMPGTRVYLKSEPLEVAERPFMFSFQEW